MPRKTPSPWPLVGIFGVSGVGHFVITDTLVRMVPRALPNPRLLVQLSGIAELACAAGLAHPRTRPAAGWASAALLLAILPANVQVALDARGGSRLWLAATVARLPMQAPLVARALRLARS